MSHNNKLLCVDDEESILRGFQLNLRKNFDLHLASDGQEGLEVFKREGGFAVVLSDMRMPRMNGAEMLAAIKAIDPEVVTVLLTGYTDFESAMAAVNEGNVFRMLSKPCPPETLNKVLCDAVNQYDLICSKRILLDKTLRGAVDALAQSLATIQPLFFGRAQRVRRLSNMLAEILQMNDAWRVDVAAVFSQLAYLSLPAHISKEVYHREKLSPEIKVMLRELPEETLKIVDLIPGLEEVRGILERIDIQPKFETNDVTGLRLGASILRLALDYDYYKEQGHQDLLILKTFESRLETYDPKVVEALSKHINNSASSFTMNEIHSKDFKEGMILAEDLLLQENMLIASSGADIDRHLLKVIRNYTSCYSENPFPEKIKVMIPVA
jgi:CheY-like chemotaxis protein